MDIIIEKDCVFRRMRLREGFDDGVVEVDVRMTGFVGEEDGMGVARVAERSGGVDEFAEEDVVLVESFGDYESVSLEYVFEVGAVG